MHKIHVDVIKMKCYDKKNQILLIFAFKMSLIFLPHSFTVRVYKIFFFWVAKKNTHTYNNLKFVFNV